MFKKLLISGVGYNPDRHEVYATLGKCYSTIHSGS